MNEIGWDIGYLLKPLLGGLGVAFIAGPLGALMVWRRLAYFGDTLAHSGLLGVTLALMLKINITLGVCLIALLVALLLIGLHFRLVLANDTLLGILSHTTLAVGLLTLAVRDDIRVDVLGLLYGDILALTWRDIMLVYGGGVVLLVIQTCLWQSLLRITVHRELAQVEGVKVRQIEMVYLLLLAILVAIAMKMVGVLLITALLIIPAAAARPLAKGPEQMAAYTSLIGMFAVLLGILISHQWDVPTGPAIVSVAAMGFLLTLLKC